MKADEAGIVISGRRWSASDFVRADGTPGPWTSKALEADPLSFKAELGRFLTEFFSPGASVTVHTSGSTGAPKAFAAEKSRMRASARATIAFLGLKPGSTNLLAMPLRFIAGKMVVVRSAECGLNLIPVEPLVVDEAHAAAGFGKTAASRPIGLELENEGFMSDHVLYFTLVMHHDTGSATWKTLYFRTQCSFGLCDEIPPLHLHG